MNISYSRVSSYMTCPYQHYLRYELGIKSKKPERPLYFGTDFHKLLELRHDRDALNKAMEEIRETFYEIPAKWQSELGENYIDDLFTIFSDYCKVYVDEKKPSVTELDFAIPMFEHKGEPIFFVGKIDELYKRKDKETGEKYLKIGEHKTFTRRPDNNTLVMNTQKCLYAYAANYLFGIFPRSVIWDYICSKPAPEPVYLEKSKRFSATRSNLVTPFSWYRACERYGVNTETIRMDEFKSNISNYFFRIEQDFDRAMVSNVWDGFMFQSRLIAKYGMKNKTKNMGRGCSFCAYRDICYTELTGGNLDYLLELQYEIYPRSDIITDERRVFDAKFYEPTKETPFD